ncbi:MAG: hypothetical protein IT204_23505 [Fimbriimonadaceae bacterium]|nr:hypothetical protein [Fimbriimonadaceae bacterium]
MPSEHDFSNASGNKFAADLRAGVAAQVDVRGGPSRQVLWPPRAEAGPNSLTGIVDDRLHYIYNPDGDVLAVRLLASLGQPVTSRPDRRGFETLISDETGSVVGLVVSGYLRRHDFLEPLLPAHPDATSLRDWLESSLAPLRALLPAA